MKKTIQQFIQETTVPEHLHWQAENWDHHSEVSKDTHEKIANALGNKSFTHFPLETESVSQADPDVVEHLTNHGYSIKDYTKGIATIKKHVGDPSRGIPMREKHVEEKIGSILERTKASDDIKKAFAADPSRQSKKGSADHHVVISTTPLAIAGMSTGTNWRNQSCMNMEGGGYAHKLKDDSEHGTHVAFLVHKDDATAFKHGEPSDPIARIALKPYHDEDGDTIFRPEDKTYGSGNSHFTRAVAKWASENYPAKEDTEYEKNDNVYDDTRNTTYRSYGKNHVEHAINNYKEIVANRGDAMDSSVIDHAINLAHEKYMGKDDLKDARLVTAKRLTDIGNLNTQQVNRIHQMVKDSPSHVRNLAIYHGDKFSTNQIMELKKTHDLPNKVLMSPKLPDAIVDSLDPSEYSFVRKSKLKPHHYDKVVDSYINQKSGSFYTLRDMSSGLTADHLTKLVDHMGKRGVSNDINLVVNHLKFNKEHHDKLVDSLSNTERESDKNFLMANSKFASFDDIDKLNSKFKNPKYSQHVQLAKNENLSDDDSKKLTQHYLKSFLESDSVHTAPGYVNMGQIPASITKHLTDDDMSKLAENEKRITFESPKDSNRYLDAIQKHIESHDKKITDHISLKVAEDPDYDEDEDDDLADKKTKMENLLNSYASNIDYHIDWHIHHKDDDGDDVIKDYQEHERMGNRIEALDDLDNYKTPNNSNRFDDTTHFDDWFQEHVDRLHELKSNTENKEDYY